MKAKEWYENLVKKLDNKEVAPPVSAHEVLYKAIEERGSEKTKEGHLKWKIFGDDIFGIDYTLDKIVNYLKAAAEGQDIGKRILLLIGPPGSSKSTIANHFKIILEEHTETNKIPYVKGSPVYDNPLYILPRTKRKELQSKGINIGYELLPSPPVQKDLLDKNWEDFDIDYVALSRTRGIGISTYAPMDPNTADDSALVGHVSLAKLAQYKEETHPNVWSYTGVLQTGNRGMVEFVEMLKAKTEHLNILLTASQDKMLILKNLPAMYLDMFLLGHSVEGTTPILYRKNNDLVWGSLESLKRDFSSSKTTNKFYCISYDFSRNKEVWVRINNVISHKFSGKMITTTQKWGSVTTTPNHSICSVTGETFFPEERKEMKAIRSIPQIKNRGSIDIIAGIPGFTMSNTLDDKVYTKRAADPTWYRLTEPRYATCIKGTYNIEDRHEGLLLKDMLSIMVWYLTEGHSFKSSSGGGIVISQKNKFDLETIQKKLQRISTAKGYINDREIRGAYRLRTDAVAFKILLEYHCGHLSVNKKLPDFVYSLPKEYLQHIFDELMVTDGSRKVYTHEGFKASKNYSERFFDYKTVSGTLAAQIGTLASLLGLDYSVRTAMTVTGKTAYGIRFCAGKRQKICASKLDYKDVSDIDVYDIECSDTHNFVCGVGNVVCHNTNHSEYEKFTARPDTEALRDRLYIIKVPYNLDWKAEKKILAKLVKETSPVDPLVYSALAYFTAASRLSFYAGDDLNKLEKLISMMCADNSDDSAIKTRRKAIQDEWGHKGISPRKSSDLLSDLIVNHKSGVSVVDVLEGIKSKFTESMDYRNDNNLKTAFDQTVIWVDKQLSTYVLEAFLGTNIEGEVVQYFQNFLKHLDAYIRKDKILDSTTSQESDPDESLLNKVDSVFEQINNYERRKEFYDRINSVIASNVMRGKTFTLREDLPDLYDGIKKLMFREKIKLVGGSIDVDMPLPETRTFLKDIVDNLRNAGFSERSAKLILKRLEHMFKKGDK